MDEQGKASGNMYWDAGDGWSYKKGDYSLLQFVAERNGDKVTVKLTKKTGKYNTENKDMAVIKIITDQGIRQASGNLVEGIEIRRKQGDNCLMDSINTQCYPPPFSKY